MERLEHSRQIAKNVILELYQLEAAGLLPRVVVHKIAQYIYNRIYGEV